MNAETSSVDLLVSRKGAEDQAWAAFGQEDWPLAQALAAKIRQRFPESFIGYAIGASALGRMSQFDEAEALCRQALELWPSSTDFGFLADYAELAQSRGDVVEASRRWVILRKHYPAHPKGYVRDAENLSSADRHTEAQALLEEALCCCPEDPGVLIQLAHSVQRRGVPSETLKRWEAVAKVCPALLDGYLGSAIALYDLGRFADAHDVLQPAVRMFPDAMYVVDLQARIAFRQDRFHESAKLWASFRDRFPENASGYCGVVDAMLALCNFAEADALIQEGRSRFPRDPHVAMSWCLVSETAQKFEDAEFRWQTACARFPTFAPILSGYARILSRNKKWSEAEAVLRAALESGGDDAELMYAYALCATERADWVQAELRWRRLMELFPASPSGSVGLGDMLRLCGRLADSTRLLEQALTRFPDNEDLEQSRAWTANFRRDWPTALGLWAELKRKYPHKPNVLSGINAALWEAGQELGIAQSEGRPAPFTIPECLLADSATSAEEDAAIKRMLLKFESLGDSCEFGIVQRRYGAEPIGLLRWATTDPPELTTALLSRLDGVGDPQFTVIESHDGEYISRDTRYAMYTHTFTPVTTEPLETFGGQYLRRLQYLRRKLLEDLASAKKIFVYKSDDGLPDEQAIALHNAIRSYNARAVLMCVRLQDAEHPAGVLHTLQEGLLIGYIDRYSTVDINVEVWLHLCRQTLALQSPSAT